jgi:hypothetical protein
LAWLADRIEQAASLRFPLETGALSFPLDPGRLTIVRDTERRESEKSS